MILRLVLSVLLAISLSCKKKDVEKSATQLLTQKAWTLVSYGYDHNANGIIDATEESIRDCDKDNKYSFNTDGTGSYEDNTLSCGNGISEMPFTWKLINKETTIDFLTGIVTILKLNNEQLIISHNANSGTPRYMEIFKH